jgi:hypothetical protein
MPRQRPGGHKYDTERARLRKKIENSGRAVDQQANALANQIMQADRTEERRLRMRAGLGPKDDRGRGERG